MTSPSRALREVWLRRVLLVFTVVATAGVLAHFGLLLWSQNEFSQPESVVAAQSMMLAQHGTLYYNLREYPYTVSAYMPIFYGLDALLIRLGIPAFTSGRLMAFAALLGIYLTVWRMMLLHTGNKYLAWIAMLLCGSSSLLLSWGTVGQVDALALFFALTAFYHFSQAWLAEGDLSERHPALRFALLFALLALFTKQTTLACPVAIFLSLLFKNWRRALEFGLAYLGIGLLLVGALNTALHGSFLANTVFANLNPFVWDRLEQHVQFFLMTCGVLLLVAILGAKSAWGGRAKPLYIYFGLALLMWLATAPKLGSDSNYQMETTVLCAMCAVAALDALEYLPKMLRGSKAWVTLLHAPLGIFLILNFRMTGPFLIMRVAKEQMFRQQVAQLRPYLNQPGRVLSTDINALVHLRVPVGAKLEVEPLIYTLLVNGGRIDPEPLRRDLANGAFSLVVLYFDLNRPYDHDPEIPSLPEGQLAEIRRHYQHLAQIPGPYLDGVHLYQFAK